ncbi:tetratricopeptide repeat protein [Allokutzneria sp. A3M-2-11 16]|uniref:BTAD domain-containing putative transcriptional regulator n=1 Tax=Allokutzneria sp. A3M-2-11 16 TaxID=2962043 RepID=UPI0020B755FF|nr:BTAD domain-containing putative transcriptional regulator [Allokutzneria sp. A3M-2-11 16]MCP3802721.1 tetratricopeptide repeat protein [Allokutzneria sp. A3M-2-11 16]
MRFGLLGPLAVWTSDGHPVRVPEPKVRALLAALLAHEGRVVSADRLAEDLWGGKQPGNPLNTLQTKVSQLRRTLGRDVVLREAPGYRINAESVDVEEFRSLATRARTAQDPRERAELFGSALALWRGPALADFADEAFAAPLVQRLEEERLSAREDWADARLALGEHGAVISELGELLARHPLRERLRSLHIRALYRAGRQSEALASYTELRDRLADELGLDPGPELTALHQAVLEQAPALDVAPPKTNLPAAVGELIGRAEAVRAVRSRLGESRLVTLIGPGGVGKTRLAVEVARVLGDSFTDGAWLLEFAGVDRQAACPPDEWVVAAIAATLGIREEPTPGPRLDLADRLAEALRHKEILLVADNCEQLVEQIAEVVARVLRRAPGVRVLATSQEPLGLAGEVLWPVPPLEVPGRSSDLATARGFSAIRLFETRAGITVDEDTAPVVAEICRRLDGIPLALELAATKVRVLGVHQLLNRLGDRFRLLAGGPRDAPARQRTLRAMIDWSWELLSEPERVLLRRLAIHAESCSLEAAEAVSGDGADVLELVSCLVDRSLVVSQVRGGAEPRYRLLESVAAYSLERVHEAGEFEELRLRHAHFYVDLAERAAPLLHGHDQRLWLERLDAETPNLRAALETAVRQGDYALAQRLVTALTWYWFLRGRLAEASRSLRLAGGSPTTRAWLTGIAVLEGQRPDLDVLDAVEELDDPRALWFLGYCMSTVGDMHTGERLTLLALKRFEEAGDQWGVAAATSDHVSQQMHKGAFAEAKELANRSARLFAELGDRWGQLQASFTLGTLAEVTGDYERAAALHRDGLRMAEELDLWPEVSYQLSWLGRIALLTKDFDRARDLHERARRLGAEQSFPPAEMYAVTGLALGARREGKFDEAEEHLRRVLAWHRGVGYLEAGALSLAELGFIEEQRGNAPSARRLHEEGLALARRTGDPRAIALALEGLAGAHALVGELSRAATLLGAADAARRSVGAPLPAAERGDVDRISAVVGDGFSADFEWGTGASLTDLGFSDT